MFACYFLLLMFCLFFLFLVLFFLYCFVLFLTFKGAMVGLWWCYRLELGLGPICQSFIVMVHSAMAQLDKAERLLGLQVQPTM